MTLPQKAPHSVNCQSGGKHVPRGAEAKVNGQAVKFEKCQKCGLRLGDRK